MFDSSYYQGTGATPAARVQNYANAIRSALTAIGQGANVPGPPANVGASNLTALLLLAAAGGGAYWLFARGGLSVVSSYARPLVRRFT